MSWDFGKLITGKPPLLGIGSKLVHLRLQIAMHFTVDDLQNSN